MRTRGVGGGSSTSPGGLAFPEEQAQTVLEYARRTGQHAAEQLINEIRDWGGHPEILHSRAETWSPIAKDTIAEADDSIDTCKAQLSAYWQGPAYRAFSVYIDQVGSVFRDTAGLMDEMSDLLQQCHALITKTYATGVKFIGECAAVILETTGGIVASGIEFVFGVAGEVIKAIGRFIEKATNLATEALQLMRNFQRITLDLKQRTSSLEVPIPLPPAANPVGSWQIREFDD